MGLAKGWPCTLQKAPQLAALAEGHVAVQCLAWMEKTSAPAHVSGPRSVAEKFKKSSIEIQRKFNSQINIFSPKSGLNRSIVIELFLNSLKISIVPLKY